MTLSEELTWRGFVNQTTYKDITALDSDPISFYWGVDPSSDSMTVGNLAIAMMVRHFINYGHKAFLLVGGATGLIGDPDGKTAERDLKTVETVESNVQAITKQYQQLFANESFMVVNNYDWFKNFGYLDFLRQIGKHVPMSQMLGREFVQSRLGQDGSGISYAEFSYALIQGYDFLHLYQQHAVSLQVCGADQWGNCIAGVDLIRRVTGQEANIWSAPLIVNRSTGVKFGKSEAGAVWLDATKTSPTEFYQFWINIDDESVESYLKLYTLLTADEIAAIMTAQIAKPSDRKAQVLLASEVTKQVHGEPAVAIAAEITQFLTGKLPAGELSIDLNAVRDNMAHAQLAADSSIIEALVVTGLAESNSDGRRLLQNKAIAINGQKVDREYFIRDDFQNGRLLLRRGKAFKDSALIELL